MSKKSYLTLEDLTRIATATSNELVKIGKDLRVVEPQYMSDIKGIDDPSILEQHGYNINGIRYTYTENPYYNVIEVIKESMVKCFHCHQIGRHHLEHCPLWNTEEAYIKRNEEQLLTQQNVNNNTKKEILDSMEFISCRQCSLLIIKGRDHICNPPKKFVNSVDGSIGYKFDYSAPVNSTVCRMTKNLQLAVMFGITIKNKAELIQLHHHPIIAKVLGDNDLDIIYHTKAATITYDAENPTGIKLNNDIIKAAIHNQLNEGLINIPKPRNDDIFKLKQKEQFDLDGIQLTGDDVTNGELKRTMNYILSLNYHYQQWYELTMVLIAKIRDKMLRKEMLYSDNMDKIQKRKYFEMNNLKIMDKKVFELLLNMNDSLKKDWMHHINTANNNDANHNNH